eukprot:CAMPEP_0175994064 /NCGR_PEP_ID=MMETSP0108-20121206/54349_1 /TAXON_ID=195067 ORGANISM="Goniomonas pacifica, Strain CCMP1869" /NCGR_SAMPLE_ID=MMETSP0108 /ASSEMBLY_ACC=CAM_ASM_000204 /LENGTH=39 /DNA_ID= /DNA_START= /DNA_END= /DNA_ORIENTATION=
MATDGHRLTVDACWAPLQLLPLAERAGHRQMVFGGALGG